MSRMALINREDNWRGMHTEVNAARRGASSHMLHSMAAGALRRANVGPWCDPVLIPIGLGRRVRALTHADERARLDGDCLSYLWVPDDPPQTGLHLFWGAALIVYQDAGIHRPSPAEVSRLAGHLALSEPDVSPAEELRLQVYAPRSFLIEHQRRRESGSGLYAAVR